MQTAQAEDLLTFALARPHDAIAAARAALAARPAPPPHDASIAHQAAGIGLRQIGRSAAAIRELRTALRLARACGRRDREVDVLATLGATLGRAGRGREGLAALDLGIRHSRGALAGRILLRRYEDALTDLRGAVTRLRRAGDVVWEARSASTAASSSSPSARPRRRTRTSSSPSGCSPRAGRSSSTRRRPTTGDCWRSPAATCRPRSPSSTRPAAGSTRWARSTRISRSTAARCCSPRASRRMRSPKPTVRRTGYRAPAGWPPSAPS